MAGQVRRKEDAVNHVMATAKLTKDQATDAVNAFLSFLKEEPAKGNKVQLIGEITAEPVYRKARKGRNPQTGGEIDIEAKNLIKLTAGSNFDKAVAHCDFSRIRESGS